jgi:hypothetical protein
MKNYVYTVVIEGTKRNCLSVLPTEFVFEKGLQSAAIVGFLKSEQIDPNDFIENKAFKDYFHQVIAQHLPKQAEFLAEGKKIGTGYVYLIDRRTKSPKGDVPVQDIIGAVNFEDGQMVSDSYLPNNNYKLFTNRGLFQLPPSLEGILLDELKQLQQRGEKS